MPSRNPESLGFLQCIIPQIPQRLLLHMVTHIYIYVYRNIYVCNNEYLYIPRYAWDEPVSETKHLGLQIDTFSVERLGCVRQRLQESNNVAVIAFSIVRLCDKVSHCLFGFMWILKLMASCLLGFLFNLYDFSGKIGLCSAEATRIKQRSWYHLIDSSIMQDTSICWVKLVWDYGGIAVELVSKEISFSLYLRDYFGTLDILFRQLFLLFSWEFMTF